MKAVCVCVCVCVTLSPVQLCDPRDCSPPVTSIHRIFQAGVLEWVAFPPPRDLLDPGIKLMSPALQANSLLSAPSGKPSPQLWPELKPDIKKLSLLKILIFSRVVTPPERKSRRWCN